MVQTLADVALWCSAAVASAEILDWFLAERQKRWLRDKFEIAWVWLDDHRLNGVATRHFVPKVVFKTLKVLFCVSMAAFLAWTEWGLTPTTTSLAADEVTIVKGFVAMIFGMPLLAAGVLAVRLFPYLSAWIAGSGTVMRRYARLATVPVITLGLLLMAVFYFPADFTDDDTQLLSLQVLMGVLFIGTLLSALLLLATAALGAIALAMLILSVVKLLALRIAEHPKGPVLGITALVGCGGALLKPAS